MAAISPLDTSVAYGNPSDPAGSFIGVWHVGGGEFLALGSEDTIRHFDIVGDTINLGNYLVFNNLASDSTGEVNDSGGVVVAYIDLTSGNLVVNKFTLSGTTIVEAGPVVVQSIPSDLRKITIKYIGSDKFLLTFTEVRFPGAGVGNNILYGVVVTSSLSVGTVYDLINADVRGTSVIINDTKALFYGNDGNTYIITITGTALSISAPIPGNTSNFAQTHDSEYSAYYDKIIIAARSKIWLGTTDGSVGTSVNTVDTGDDNASVKFLSDDRVLMVNEGYVKIYNFSGLTLTEDVTETISTAPGGAGLTYIEQYTDKLLYVKSTSGGSYASLYGGTPLPPPDEPILQYLATSIDVEANGAYLYIGVTDRTNQYPSILRIPTDLSEDAELMYDPQAGTDIYVMCGDYQKEVIWAVGDFGSDKVVKFFADEEIYWTNDPQQSQWSGVVKPLLVGPSDDKQVIVTVPDSLDIYESYFVDDVQSYWTLLSNYFLLPFKVDGIDRLDTLDDSIIIGVEVENSYWYNPYMVNFSPNRAFTFYDITGNLYPSDISEKVSVTSVIYGAVG